jgi:hypothetical protein
VKEAYSAAFKGFSSPKLHITFPRLKEIAVVTIGGAILGEIGAVVSSIVKDDEVRRVWALYQHFLQVLGLHQGIVRVLSEIKNRAREPASLLVQYS